MDSVPGALATAAAVTPSVDVIPLPATEHHFMPPTATFGAYGNSPFHRWWNETPTGISLLKFGTSYKQYQTPTDDDVRAADIAYLGGREYVISDSEVAALTAAGYGPNIWDVSVPYVAPVMGGVANSGPPHVNIASISPPPAVASAGATAPDSPSSPSHVGTVTATPATASAQMAIPAVTAGTFNSATVTGVPASATAAAVAPTVTGGFVSSGSVTAVPAVANAAGVAPAVTTTSAASTWPQTWPFYW